MSPLLKDQVTAHLTRNTQSSKVRDVGATKRASDAYPPRLFSPDLASRSYHYSVLAHDNHQPKPRPGDGDIPREMSATI